MAYARYFVLFFMLNASFCVGLTNRYLHTHASFETEKRESGPVRTGDIFLPLEPRPILVGVSWYGEKFHGKKTASGDVFDMNSISVAHVSLPFGTKLSFFNPNNNKRCDAVVNDSGPFNPNLLPNLEPHPRRQFDVSRALAECLGFVEQGVINLYVTGTHNNIYLTHEEAHSDRIAKSDERFAKSGPI